MYPSRDAFQASLRKGGGFHPLWHLSPPTATRLNLYSDRMQRSFGAEAGPPAPILPRASNAASPGSKKCEMCGRGHDATFGAGRFCSSKCARTVGGLAHRRKRALERAAQYPPSVFASAPPVPVSAPIGLPKPAVKGKGKGGRRMSTLGKAGAKTGSKNRITIPSLLNPEK